MSIHTPAGPMAFLLCAVAFLTPSPGQARPEFAQATGNPCSVCHISPLGGGPLTAGGEAFRDTLSDLSSPIDPRFRVSPAQRLLHLLVYTLHIPFGAGLIVLFLSAFWPAAGGRAPAGVVPRAYLRPLITCLAAISLAGPFLFLYKVRTVPGLFSTRFGILLAVKACAAAVLVASSAGLIWHGAVVLARRYRALSARRDAGESLDLADGDLALFSGVEGKKAFVAVDGVVHDATGRDLWRAGRHPGGHTAGKDLTAMLSEAPHGREVFAKVPVAGRLVARTGTGRRNAASWLAALGVAAAAVIVAVVALWRL